MKIFIPIMLLCTMITNCSDRLQNNITTLQKEILTMSQEEFFEKTYYGDERDLLRSWNKPNVLLSEVIGYSLIEPQIDVVQIGSNSCGAHALGFLQGIATRKEMSFSIVPRVISHYIKDMVDVCCQTFKIPEAGMPKLQTLGADINDNNEQENIFYWADLLELKNTFFIALDSNGDYQISGATTAGNRLSFDETIDYFAQQKDNVDLIGLCLLVGTIDSGHWVAASIMRHGILYHDSLGKYLAERPEVVLFLKNVARRINIQRNAILEIAKLQKEEIEKFNYQKELDLKQIEQDDLIARRFNWQETSLLPLWASQYVVNSFVPEKPAEKKND
jgi:hypothetical protein